MEQPSTTGGWAAMVRDGKASLRCQLQSRVKGLKKICQHADLRTRKMVASGLITSKLQYLLPLYGAAPDYLMQTLEVQQMAAARAVLGRCAWCWSNARILSSLGWLNISQLYVSSVLTLAHKIVTTLEHLPENRLTLRLQHPSRDWKRAARLGRDGASSEPDSPHPQHLQQPGHPVLQPDPARDEKLQPGQVQMRR